MKNLIKSLIVVTTLGTIHQVFPMLGKNPSTWSPTPWVSKLIGSNPNTWSPTVDITGVHAYAGMTGTYNPTKGVNKAVLTKTNSQETVTFTDVQERAQRGTLKPSGKNGYILFAQVATQNPHYNKDNKNAGRAYKHVELYGKLQKKKIT